jgi:hypothetical protein
MDVFARPLRLVPSDSEVGPHRKANSTVVRDRTQCCPEGELEMMRVLFVGQKPETVDFSDPALPQGSMRKK